MDFVVFLINKQTIYLTYFIISKLSEHRATLERCGMNSHAMRGNYKKPI